MEHIQELYVYAIEYERIHDPQKLEELENIISSLDDGDLVAVVKSFTHMLTFANISNDVHIAHPTKIKNLKKGDLVDERLVLRRLVVELKTIRKHVRSVN